MTITWGKNTVFNTPGAPNAAPSTPSKSTSSFSFGPPPATGLPPAATTTSSFSFSTPSTPQTPTSTTSGLFTANAGSTPGGNFFSSTPITTPQQQQQQQAMGGGFGMSAAVGSLGAPQQAAFQAHMNATMIQESNRLQSELTNFFASYSPYQSTTTAVTVQPTTSGLFGQSTPQQPAQQSTTNTTCQFQHIFYDIMTDVQKAEKLSLGSGNYPQKPLHIPTEIWSQALSRNPNPDEYIPVLITSAEGLHSRLVSQQSKMNYYESSLDSLQDTVQKMLHRQMHHENTLILYQKQNVKLKRRLMTIMQKVDLIKGKNVPFTAGETELICKLRNVMSMAEQLDKALVQVKSQGEQYQNQWNHLEQRRMSMGLHHYADGGSSLSSSSLNTLVLHDGYKKEVHGILNGCNIDIQDIKKQMKTDGRDLAIIKNDLRRTNI